MMKKRITPILIILALIVVGGAGYMIGQNSSKDSLENLSENIQGESGVLEDENLPVNNPDYFETVTERLLMWPIVDVNAYVEPTETSEVTRVNPKGVSVLVLEKGHGKYDGWYHVSGMVEAKKYDGYVESKYLSLEKVEVEKIQIAEQMPAEQKPAVQKPVEQQPTSGNDNTITWEDIMSHRGTGTATEEDTESEDVVEEEETSSEPPEEEAVEKPKNNHPGYYIYNIGNTMHGVYRNVVDAMKSGEAEVVEREKYYEVYGKYWVYKMDKEVYKLVMESINE